ncbi:tRNA-specific 2-thiouridylase MnmA [Streptomyces misionensis JCM 4497]
MHHRGLPRRPPRRRRHRHPLLRLGPRRPLPRGRRGGLRRRVRGRPHPQPLPALQREDQVRRAARQGAGPRLRRRLHRPLRQGDRPRGRLPRAAPRLRHGQGPVVRPRRAGREAARARDVPARRHGHHQGGDPRRGRAPGPGGRQEARLARHLLHRRRRHPGLPRPAARQGRGRHRGRVRHPPGHARGRVRLHDRPAQGTAHRHPGPRRQAALRPRHLPGDQHGHRRPGRRPGRGRPDRDQAPLVRHRPHRPRHLHRPAARPRRRDRGARRTGRRRTARHLHRAGPRRRPRPGDRPLRRHTRGRLGDHRLHHPGDGGGVTPARRSAGGSAAEGHGVPPATP